jgi:DNA adenine methylase
MFNKTKESNLENWLDCLAMFQYSFWAIFKWSWSKNKRWTDYVKECVSNNIKQSKNIQWVKFIHSSYWDLEIPKESIIYCDIPYKWTAKYKWVGEFNYEEFYKWCREKKKEWHTIFISEYNMPDDFKIVWQQEIVNNLNNKKATEKLFTL